LLVHKTISNNRYIKRGRISELGHAHRLRVTIHIYRLQQSVPNNRGTHTGSGGGPPRSARPRPSPPRRMRGAPAEGRIAWLSAAAIPQRRRRGPPMDRRATSPGPARQWELQWWATSPSPSIKQSHRSMSSSNPATIRRAEPPVSLPSSPSPFSPPVPSA
jgi:hypothetical protein